MTKEEKQLIDKVIPELLNHLELLGEAINFSKTFLTPEQLIQLQEFIESKRLSSEKSVELIEDMEKLEELLEKVDNEQN